MQSFFMGCEQRPMSDANKNQNYLSVNFYASVFLILKGGQIIGIKKSENNSKQFVFIFRDFPQRKELLQQFNFSPENSPDLMVDFRKAVAVIKSLKEKLWQQKL